MNFGIHMCKSSDISEIFSSISDPRQAWKVSHPLEEILFLILCATISDCDGWEDIEDYGIDKLPLLRTFFPYKHGIPSDNTLGRIFASIDPDGLRDCFTSFVSSLFPSAGDHVIAIDGKASRGSRTHKKSALHTVSAFAAEARIVLAQVAAQEKSNEITAIPQLLDLLDLRGVTVTIDAAGCQTKVAEKIVDKGGDYVFGLKGNQKTLHNGAKQLFKTAKTFADSYEESASGHGRTETRRCDILNAEDTGCLLKTKDFPHLKSVIRITATRTIKEKTAVEERYYLSSLAPDAKRLEAAVRGHWSIENSLHWVLDVSFNEDASRIRKDNAPLCMPVMRHLALNLTQTAKKKGESVKRLRKKAARNDDTLIRILNESRKCL